MAEPRRWTLAKGRVGDDFYQPMQPVIFGEGPHFFESRIQVVEATDFDALKDDLADLKIANEQRRDELGAIRTSLSQCESAYQNNIKAWHDACNERDQLRAERDRLAKGVLDHFIDPADPEVERVLSEAAWKWLWQDNNRRIDYVAEHSNIHPPIGDPQDLIQVLLQALKKGKNEHT